MKAPRRRRETCMAKPYGPYLEMARIQSEINRLFDNLLDLGDEEKGTWMPNADIVETEESLELKVELPGVDGKSLWEIDPYELCHLARARRELR